MNEEETQALAISNEIDTVWNGQRDFDISDLVWRQKDKTPIRLGDMADSHLRNTALMLIGMGYQEYKVSDPIRIKWLKALRMEWDKRMSHRTINGQRIQQQVK